MMPVQDQKYIKLEVERWLNSTKLKNCSAATHGVYISIMCLMHKSSAYGKIVIKPKYMEYPTFAANLSNQVHRHVPFAFDTVKKAVEELLEEGVLVQEKNNMLVSENMVHTYQVSNMRSKVGKKGGTVSIAKVRETAEQAAVATGKKNKYADNVRMTNEQYQKLIDKHGKPAVDWMITKLDAYKGSKGKKYRDDYKAILNWVVSAAQDAGVLEKTEQPKRQANYDDIGLD